MNILVTGAAGFIGSHLVERLLNDGHCVIGLDNLSSGSIQNIAHISKERFQFVDRDVRREIPDSLPAVELIIHLAAIGSVPRSLKDPTMYMQNNVLGFHNVLEFARRRHVKSVFYASSSSVYGRAKGYYRHENDALEPINPYAASKQINEVMAQTYARAFWINCVGLRFFNVFGPRQRMNSEYAAVVPRFCEGIIKNAGVTIFGTGEQIRTFTPVDYVVESIAQMIRLNGTLKYPVYNVTHQSYAMDVNAIAKLIGALLKKPYALNRVDARAGDIVSSIGNGARLTEELGHFHEEFPIIESMRETCQWYSNKLNQ